MCKSVPIDIFNYLKKKKSKKHIVKKKKIKI